MLQSSEEGHRVHCPLADGAPVHWRFHLPEGTIGVTNYHLAPATMERAMEEAGLRDIRWHPAEVSPEGRAQWGDAHWQPFLDNPPIAFLDCVK